MTWSGDYPPREQYNPNVSSFDQPYREGPERTYPGPDDPKGTDIWAKVDSIRWGDVAQVQVTPPAGLAVPIAFTSTISRQLVNTHTPRPIAWLLQFMAEGVSIAAGETGNITVKFFVTIGAGQSQTTLLAATLVLTAANGYRDFNTVTVPPQIFLPASDVQVTATMTLTTDVPGTDIVLVSCMASPWTTIALAPGALR